MPVRTMAMLSDEDVGLPHDPIAQEAAETYIAAWTGWTLKQEAKAQAQTAKVVTVEVPVADDTLSIRDVPADVLDGIAAELCRIAHRSGGSPGYSPYQA